MLPFFEGYRKYDLPVRLNSELYDGDSNRLTVIDKINKVNIFVGPNNSGKSLLMRELTKTMTSSYYGKERWAEIYTLIEFYQAIVKRLRDEFQVVDLISFGDTHSGIIIDLQGIIDMHVQHSKYKGNYDVMAIVQHLRTIFDRPFEYNPNRGYYYIGPNKIQVPCNHQTVPRSLETIFLCLNDLKQEAATIIKGLLKLQLPPNRLASQKIYIPTFRSLKEFKNAQIALIIQGEYNFENNLIVYTGQDFPLAVDNHKNNSWEYRKKIISYESFLSDTFFQSKKIELTYHKNDKVLLIKIGNEKDRPIHELGDGLQMIIILTFPFFMYSIGTISIEEPELFIHPGLQKEFLNFLVTHPVTKDFQIFITTHSNHILDSINASNQVSIFSVNKKQKQDSIVLKDEEIPDFIIDNLANGDNNLLRLLGVTSTSVYLSNCVIWVEGITDKLYIQKYMEVYMNSPYFKEKYAPFKNYKEGINYSFSLTGGDSIVHLDFESDSEYENDASKIIVNKFCSKSFVIVDNDSDKNKERKKKLAHSLQGRFIELDVPEIENLIPKEVLPDILLTYKSVKAAIGNGSLETVTDLDLKTHKIGKLIDEHILKGYKDRKYFSGQNGSLKSADKYDFCIRATGFITSSNLNEYKTKIIEQVFDFILSMNTN